DTAPAINDTDNTTADAGVNTADAGVNTAANGTAGKPLKANMTDPQSRLLKTRNGWIQGYNCQTAGSDDGFILHTNATQDANDVNQFMPTMNAVTDTAATLAARTGRADLATIGDLLADAGYDSDDNLAADGPDRLIADGKRHTMTQRAAAE